LDKDIDDTAYGKKGNKGAANKFAGSSGMGEDPYAFDMDDNNYGGYGGNSNKGKKFIKVVC